MGSGRGRPNQDVQFGARGADETKESQNIRSGAWNIVKENEECMCRCKHLHGIPFTYIK